MSASTASTVSELSPGKKVRINKNGVGSEKWGSKKLGKFRHDRIISANRFVWSNFQNQPFFPFMILRPKVDAVDLCVQNLL